jgi:hypothetical protein
LLAYLLDASPQVSLIRGVIRKRLLDEPRIVAGEKQMGQMLLTLHESGYVQLEPPPVKNEEGKYPADYHADRAAPTDKLPRLLGFRSAHPLYGAFLVEVLGKANWDERVQPLESVLEMPRPLLKFVRPKGVPPGPLETEVVRPVLEQHGLLLAKPQAAEGEEEDEFEDEEPEPWFAEKLRMYFEVQRPEVSDVEVFSVWCAGDLLQNFGGNFNLYVRTKDLTKQEGIIFRHLLRLILLCEEFAQLSPPDLPPEEWQTFLRDLANRLTDSCRRVDPTSTEEAIQRAHSGDALVGQGPAVDVVPPSLSAIETPKTESQAADVEEEFGAGLD